MAGITLVQAQSQLDAWINASMAVAEGGQAYVFGRSVTRADAGKILEMINFWDAKVKELSSNTTGGMKVFSGVPVDN